MVRVWVEKNQIKREKGKNPQFQTLAKMRHPGTYLGLPMPDPTLSEPGKGTWGLPVPTLGLIGSGSRIRASQCDCSTMVRSPLGERRLSASRRVTAPLLRLVATPAASLAWVESEAGEETNELGFAGKRPLGGFVHGESRAWPSIADGRLTAFWVEWGPVVWWNSQPRPSLHSGISMRAGLGRLRFSRPVTVKFFFFKNFLFFRNSNKFS
jgi:hypothetical protein